MLDFDNDKLRNSIIRALAYGTPEFIEDLRTQLLEYTSIPGIVFASSTQHTLHFSFPQALHSILIKPRHY